MIIFINSYLHKKENLFSQFSPVFPPIGIGYLASISLEKNIQLINIIRLNTKLLLNCIRNNELLNFEVDYLIVAIGRERNLPEINEKALKSDRLFLIGDVASERNIRQASIAAGKGIEVAMKVYFANRDTI